MKLTSVKHYPENIFHGFEIIRFSGMFQLQMKIYTNLPPVAIYVVLLLAVMTLSPALYEIIRRIPFIRWCVLGIKKKK